MKTIPPKTILVATPPKLEAVDLVLGVKEPRTVSTKYGQANITLALIVDQAGKTNSRLWHDQVDIAKLGETIKAENGLATEFGEVTKANVGSRGELL